MKKLMLLIPLVGIALVTNAWEDKGTYTQTGPGNSKCDGDVGICMESQDPNDPSPSPGDKIIIHNKGKIEKATIVAIMSAETGQPIQDPPLPSRGGVIYETVSE